jgi:glycogen operon protein
MRDYWTGADSMLGEFGLRFTGRPDLYKGDYRRPTASINFITAHDGFTLNDLVSYNDKHNDANGEDNKDGESTNRSWNCGAEGPTDDKLINELRQRQKRNLMATLLLSQGTPMVVAGDEFGRTQNGNNNAYCQDNEISWLNWENTDQDMLAFTRKVIQIRKDHPAFRRRRWFKGEPIKGLEDIAWFLPDGTEMSDENWNHDFAKSLGVFLNGQGLHYVNPVGEKVTDDNFYLIFNAHFEAVEYKIPSKIYNKEWTKILDTSEVNTELQKLNEKDTLEVQGRSIILLQHHLKKA